MCLYASCERPPRPLSTTTHPNVSTP